MLRIVLALRPGVWGDEIFSLAMATGHSLEHPAAEARPALGDFVQPPAAAASSSFRRYAEHGDHAGPGRVIRAVLLSDTNPPLYYLLLGAWTRLAGTDDQALRLFSLLWATLTLPLLWRLGRDLGDRGVGWTAVVLYAWSPVSVFYSIEGRMYSMVWCLATALAWLTLRLVRDGGRPSRAAAWIIVVVAGSYTHYFFAFVVLACGCLDAAVARAPLATGDARDGSGRRARRGPMVPAGAGVARALAGYRYLAQRSASLARAGHPSVRARVEPARGWQSVGWLARRWTQSSPLSTRCWPFGCSAAAR